MRRIRDGEGEVEEVVESGCGIMNERGVRWGRVVKGAAGGG